MKTYLFIDTKGDSAGLLQFLTLCSAINAIGVTQPERFYRESNNLSDFKNPYGSYKSENYNFVAVDSELIEKVKTTEFITGTLNKNMYVIKNTKENRKILGI